MTASLFIKTCRTCGLALAFFLTGCINTEPISVQLVGYNHTDDYIGAFYVDGTWGGNVFEHSGGGSFACCIGVPRKWTSDLKVRIDWVDKNSKEHTISLPVPNYNSENVGQINVHFLKNGKIKVFVTGAGLRHPTYPLKGEEAKL